MLLTDFIAKHLVWRAALAGFTAFVVTWCLIPRLIKTLTARAAAQPIRNDGPQSHLSKAGTPTMGGIVILFAMVFATLLWADWHRPSFWLVLGVMVLNGSIGFIDDYKKIVKNTSSGLSFKAKMLWQSVIATLAGVCLVQPGVLPAHTGFALPFVKAIVPIGALGFCILAYFVIVGTANAVNLTDGLDGLAIILLVLLAAAFSVFAYVASQEGLSAYFGIPYLNDASELVIFCAAMMGAGLGFLWFNAYPAAIFMGDVGALALGAALGMLAVLLRQEMALFIMGGVFVMEAVSVMLQVLSFKTTGKRMFRMAPLHHHYELKGWKETHVIIRFWIVTILLIVIATLATFRLH